MWSPAVGWLPYVSYRDQIGWPLEINHCGSSLCADSVSSLPCRVSSRRRGTLGTAPRRIRLGGNRPDWSVAFSRTPQRARDEVLWVVRDCLSEEILLARPLLSSTQGDLTALLTEVKELLVQLKVPVKGVISDGEETIGSAVAFVFPKVPHQLCQFHYLKDATKPLYEADRHAKTQLKKQLRGVRPIERALEEQKTPENEAIRGYCLAVRASLTDDGRSPLHPSGLKLHDRVTQVSDSIGRVQEKKDYHPH